jgi:hypothetical protein
MMQALDRACLALARCSWGNILRLRHTGEGTYCLLHQLWPERAQLLLDTIQVLACT